MKKLLLLCAVLLVGQNSFGEFNPFERSCYDLLDIIRRSFSTYNDRKQTLQLIEDVAKLESFEILPSEFLEKYKDMLADKGFFSAILDMEFLKKCSNLAEFKKEMEKLK